MIEALLLLAAAQAAPQCTEFQVVSAAPEPGKLSFTLIPSQEGATYNWTVSVGAIEAGQGTSQVTVAADTGAFVTASVDVGGVPRDCPSFISASDEVRPADDEAPCPALGVDFGKTSAGQPIFRVTADPIPKGDFTFNWSVSAGSIADGQGTGNILVEADKGTSITATVEVGGLPPECSRSASTTGEID